MDGPRGRSERVLKILPSPRIDSRTLQRVASCSKDYATPTAYSICKLTEYSRIILRGTLLQPKCRSLQLTVIIC
jgi:hypothetical protein